MKNKFQNIYQDIAENIDEGVIQPNSKLPSEHELAAQYDASRETVRKALNLLAQNGYIQKIRGSGSVVLDVRKFDFPVSGLVSFKELASKMGDRWRTIVTIFDSVQPDNSMMRQLNIAADQHIWEVARVREIDGEKIILDKDYLVQAVAPKLTKEICENSIYQYIEDELGLTISFAKKEITVEEPTEEDRQCLDLEGYFNIVVVKNHVYLDDASLFQYTESRHRPDKFKFVDFARRHHS